jgi:hypothetical protein
MHTPVTVWDDVMYGHMKVAPAPTTGYASCNDRDIMDAVARRWARGTLPSPPMPYGLECVPITLLVCMPRVAAR